MHNKESLKKQIEALGLKDNDTLLIHSSLKSVGLKIGQADELIELFEENLKNGLLIFPTHTWSYIKEDGDVFDKVKSNSCVGVLTNIARIRKEFVRSNHPTHSVCATGKNVEDYIRLDDETTTPTKPDGCFGTLKDMNAKILFLGACTSKNTFIHSIEEYMNVKKRFTDKKFRFTTIKEDGSKMEYHVYRHYNEDCPHISDNYEKLLPYFLRFGIATKHLIGDAESYLVDAKKCFDFVCMLISKDEQVLSDKRQIDNLL